MNTACTLPTIMNHNPLLGYDDSKISSWGCGQVQRIKGDGYEEECQKSEMDISSQPRHTDENSQSSSSSDEETGYYSSKTEGLESENGGDMERSIFSCPVCSFTTTTRCQFTDHVSTHCNHKCTFCDIKCQDLEELRRHLAEEHQGEEEPGVRIPRINTQGKVKTFRCKQCKFVAVTKLDFWEHSKCHIKVEKLLTCPKCPFVTEYKHHLEYHLRNHFKSKPFKCNQCSYSCVNKSMLNSHLKSHSSIYQYHCADCSYATKYCHSLKLHLRKYGHKPAMVLNADGSPNPLPIIDVYGTRRGPKQKSKIILPEDGMKNSDFALFQASYSIVSNSPQPNSFSIPFSYNSLINGFATPHTTSLIPPPSSILSNQSQNDSVNHHQDIVESYLDKMLLSAYNNNNNKNSSNDNDVDSTLNSKLDSTPPSEEIQEEVEETRNNITPLDLSKPECNEFNKNVKNRRKGKAFKFERTQVLKEQPEQEDNDEGKCEPVAPIPMQEEFPKPYTCPYCEITFKELVLYQLHMGYHDYQHPFKCNRCGEETEDKVAFFLHVARKPHS